MATKLAHMRSVQAMFTWGEAPSFEVRPLGAAALGAVEREAAYRLTKRFFDIAVASLLLIALAPLMLVIALLIVLDSPGPAFFVQKRVRGDQTRRASHPEEHVFDFIKFRTMVHGADPAIHQEYMRRMINGNVHKTDTLYKLVDDPRITRVGHWLRRTSLDELPQLINILRGDMTFVGPRPALPYEVANYKPHYLERLAVTQGLTGLWQVMGRNELNFDEMVALDVRYARNRSFLGDVKILAATIPAMLTGR